jgi:Bacterial SH3 domain
MLLAKRDEFARKAEWFRFLAARDRGALHPNGTPSDGSDRLGLDSSIEGSPPAPKRSLKPFLTTLWLTGAAMYLISTVLFTNAINGLGDKNEQEPNLEVNRQLALPRDFASNEETAQVQSTASPTSPAPYGTHAISPGQPPYESPDLIVPAAAMGEGNNTSSVPQERTQQASAPPASPEPEVLEVHQAATIQNGPSSAAAVIGTARPGAQVQIKARENAWIQFVDPTSGNTGWMESYLLTTPGSPQGGSNVAEHAENSPGLPLQTPKPVKKRVKKKSSEPPEIAEQPPSVPPARDRAYAELHEDDGFVVDRSFRRNGFLAKPRMLRQGLMSPDFIPPR